MTGRRMCAAERASFSDLPQVVRGRWACIRPEGHPGRHLDLTGDTWFVTPELAEAVAVSVAGEILRNAVTPARGEAAS